MDGANAARAFLRRHKISQEEIDTVWTAIALHTTPGIPQYMHPVVALLTNGVEMDVLGIAYSDFPTTTAMQSSPHIHVRGTSKKISSTLFTKESNTSLRRHWAMFRWMYWVTRIPGSSA